MKYGFSNDIFTNNSLLWMYSTCQVLDVAFNLFDQVPERNRFSWTSMISDCICNNEHEMSLLIFLEMMRSEFKRNEFCLSSVLCASTVLDSSKLGSSFHSLAFKIGIEKNSFVGSSLCLYAKCGNIESAGCIHHQDLASCNSMAELSDFTECHSLIPVMVFVVQISKKYIEERSFLSPQEIIASNVQRPIDAGHVE
ncbi:Pentatricopeptide repeat-containing protein [Apostasia shenzhenica]|uniref:Pentatricopeptide repeat-containing protein n=1 Tax=Apostasia shenzhenica TaxID=1088818 RepID=A0A2I0BBS1_9ASPA|nr:Pentatricopeptide repeat-containing protein [Apostasia shenzhenica]